MPIQPAGKLTESKSRHEHFRLVMAGEDEQWLLLSLVFGWVDAKTLSTCCCISREWCGVAKQETFWKDLCEAKWPSSASETASTAITAVGGYRKYYSLRLRAQQHVSVPRRKLLEPRLAMEDLIIFLDVVYNGMTVCSFLKSGEQLEPMISRNADQKMFRFWLDLPEIPSYPCPANRTIPRSLPSKNLNYASAPSTSPDGFQGWKKEQVQDFQISWAVMEKGSHKMLQLLQSKGGSMVGDTCTFSDWLPGHSCCPSGDTSHIAEVDIMCQSILGAPGEQLRPLDDGLQETLILQQLKFGFMICQEWRYFSQLQARRYLQHIFHHEM